MNKRELEFRKELLASMSGTWTPTIHVENHLNPGVPDLSYVMNSRGCETGWLELKCVPNTPNLNIKIESSQYEWTRAHSGRVPIHFLIAVDQFMYLIPGCQINEITPGITPMELSGISYPIFLRVSTRRELPRLLTQLTDRRQNLGT